MKPTEYVPQVREQYEALPYPVRDPRLEEQRLMWTWLDDLAMINHYCFAGRQTFEDGFRALVAGGGTGDATIFLAEQLRHTNAHIVHLDISQASISVARERARVRNLNNISWVNDSLLVVHELGLGKFDYINCSGVLHHLEDPDAGLGALLAALTDHGALGVMVYARYGRTGVYQMQELLRLVNQGVSDVAGKIRIAREVLESAPPTNWFKRGEEQIIDHKSGGDPAIYDLLLHSHDRAYSVGELYDWFHDRRGLHLALTDRLRGRSAYLPDTVVTPKQPDFLKHVRTLPLRQQYEIGELLSGGVITHSFYATRSADATAQYGDAGLVPAFFVGPSGLQLAALIRRHHARPFLVQDRELGILGLLHPGKYGESIVKHIDGRKTFGQVFSLVRMEPQFRNSAPSDDDLFRDFRPVYDFLNAVERLLLRHPSVKSRGNTIVAAEPAAGPVVRA